MKTKFTAVIILSAMLLTACNSGNRSADNIPAETEQTETMSQTVTAASRTETEAPETTTVTASETAEETTTTATEIESPKIENVSENVTLDIETIDISNIVHKEHYPYRILFWGDVAAIGTYGSSGSADKICFFDVNDRSLKGKITSPDGWDFAWQYHCIKGSGDILCRVELYRYNEQGGRENAVLVVHNDFSTEIIEGEKIAIPVGSHNISDVLYNIYDTDSDKVIVEGFEDTKTELGLASKWFDYKFPIGNDRFVYLAHGFERVLGFGCYDFTKGKAVSFPDSEDFVPVGYHDGKIYAAHDAWGENGCGELYTFDAETFEKKHFMSSPAAVDFYDHTNYYMSPNGEYIIASHHKYDREHYSGNKNTIFVISPDSGEVLAKCEFSGININSAYSIEFIDDSSFAALNVFEEEIYVFNITT